MANPNEPGLNGTPWVVRQLWEQVLVIWHLVMASSGFKALVFSTCQQFEECYWIQMIHRSPSAIQLYQLYPLLRYNKILYVRIKSFFFNPIHFDHILSAWNPLTHIQKQPFLSASHDILSWELVQSAEHWTLPDWSGWERLGEAGACDGSRVVITVQASWC